MAVKNLGIVKAIFDGDNPPQTTFPIWYNTRPDENRHYYYDVIDNIWRPLNELTPGQIANLITQLGLNGGLTGQVLTKISNADGDYEWQDVFALLNLNGGNTADVLTKISNADGDYSWQPPPTAPLTEIAQSFTATLAAQGATQTFQVDGSIVNPTVLRKLIPQIIESGLNTGGSVVAQQAVYAGAVLTGNYFKTVKVDNTRALALPARFIPFNNPVAQILDIDIANKTYQERPLSGTVQTTLGGDYDPVNQVVCYTNNRYYAEFVHLRGMNVYNVNTNLNSFISNGSITAPSAPVYSSSTGLFYFTNGNNGNEFWSFSASSSTFVNTGIALAASYPSSTIGGITLLATGDFIYVFPRGGSGIVSKINVQTNTLVATINTGINSSFASDPIVIGDKIYVFPQITTFGSSPSRAIYEIDIVNDTFQATQLPSVLSYGTNLDIGNNLVLGFAMGGANNYAAVIDTTNNSVQETSIVGVMGMGRSAIISPGVFNLGVGFASGTGTSTSVSELIVGSTLDPLNPAPFSSINDIIFTQSQQVLRQANIGIDYEVTFNEIGNDIIEIVVQKLLNNGSRDITLNLVTSNAFV